MSQTPQPVQSISLLEFELMINTVNLLLGVIVSLAGYLEQHGARCLGGETNTLSLHRLKKEN